MKITHVICQILRIQNVEAKTAGTQDSLLIRVRTDTGLEGVGEADASPEILKAVIDAPFSHNIACGLRELLIGENPLETERIWQKLYRRTMYFGRRAVGIAAMAGVDMALWDLKGKYFGEPIHRLLGGKLHSSIPAYASILFGRDGLETREIAQRWKKSGCFKDFQIGWLEEPLHQDDLDGYVWLRDRSPVPIAAGEGECGRAAFKPWIDRHALDVYQVDLARNGFTDGNYIRQRVEEAGGRLCNHCYKTPISVAGCLHWLSSCRDAFLFEDCVEDSPLRHELTLERMQAVDGRIAVPDRPGLGITLNEKFVAEHLIAESGR